MAGFQQDVTKPVDIPQVQVPNFSDNRSTVQDVADIATFGVGLYQQVEASKLEQRRQQAQIEGASFVDNLVTSYIENSKQEGGRAKSLAIAQKAISGRGTPLQSASISEEFGKRISILEKGIDFSKEQDKPSDAFGGATKEIQGKARAILGIDVDPEIGTVERDKLNAQVNKLMTLQISQEANIEKVRATGAENQADIDDLEVSTKGVLNSEIVSIVNEMTRMLEESVNLPSGEQLVVMNNIRDSSAILKGTAIGYIEKIFAGTPSSKIGKTKENMMISLNNLFSPFEDADDEAIKRSADNLSYLVSDLGLNILTAGNSLALTRAAYGKDIPELTWNYILENKTVAGTLEQAIEDTLGLTSDQKKAMTLKTLHEYVAGGGSADDVGDIPLSKEVKAGLFKTGFNIYKKATRDGSLMGLDQVPKGQALDAMIHILGDANSQDSQTNDNIMQWVSDPNFQELLKTADPTKSKAIQNMLITASKNSIRSPDGAMGTINKNPTLYKFDTKTRQFSLSDTGNALPLLPDVQGGGQSSSNSRRSAQRIADKANRDLKVFTTNEEANDGLADVSSSERLSWLLLSGAGSATLSPKVAVTGTPLVLPQEDTATAIANQQKVSEYKAQKEEIARIAGLPNEVLLLQEKIKGMRDTGITSSDPTAGLDKDQKIEYYKQALLDLENAN